MMRGSRLLSMRQTRKFLNLNEREPEAQCHRISPLWDSFTMKDLGFLSGSAGTKTGASRDQRKRAIIILAGNYLGSLVLARFLWSRLTGGPRHSARG